MAGEKTPIDVQISRWSAITEQDESVISSRWATYQALHAQNASREGFCNWYADLYGKQERVDALLLKMTMAEDTPQSRADYARWFGEHYSKRGRE